MLKAAQCGDCRSCFVFQWQFHTDIWDKSFFFIPVSNKFTVFVVINSPNFESHKIEFFSSSCTGKIFYLLLLFEEEVERIFRFWAELVIRKGENHHQLSSFHLVPHIWHVHKLLLWTCEKLKVMFWELQGTFLILKFLPVWTCHKEEGKIHQSLEHEQRAKSMNKELTTAVPWQLQHELYYL